VKKPGLLLATLAAGGLLNAQETRLVRFGLLTDTHVCDKGDQSRVITVNATARHFTAGLAKIEAFAGTMNASQAAFVAELARSSLVLSTSAMVLLTREVPWRGRTQWICGRACCGMQARDRRRRSWLSGTT
jgi:hypothetical protein